MGNVYIYTHTIYYTYIYISCLEQFLFFHILGIIILTDYIILFRGVGIPPTRDGSKPVTILLLSYGWNNHPFARCGGGQGRTAMLRALFRFDG